MRLAAATLLALALCAGVLWAGTDGLSAFTTEQARRLAIARHPAAVPAALLEDGTGRSFRLDEYRGTAVAVEFIYTRCRTLCAVMGSGFERLQGELEQSGDELRLLSVSFDPEHDTPAALADYARRYRADAARWRIARVADRSELAALLATFGVVVIPDALGEFQHNGAIHLLDREGRLARILDLDASAAELRAHLANL